MHILQACMHRTAPIYSLLLLQIWDYISGKLKKDLQYQAEEHFMLHDTAVLALAFSSNSDILVSGSQDGKIKVGCTIDFVEKAHCLVILLAKRVGCTLRRFTALLPCLAAVLKTTARAMLRLSAHQVLVSRQKSRQLPATFHSCMYLLPIGQVDLPRCL